MSPKKLNFEGVNRQFQAKITDCGWTVVCRLRVKYFLRVAVLGSVIHTTRITGRVSITCKHGPCTWTVLTGVQGIFDYPRRPCSRTVNTGSVFSTGSVFQSPVYTAHVHEPC